MGAFKLYILLYMQESHKIKLKMHFEYWNNHVLEGE